MRNFCNLFGLEQLYFSFSLALGARPKTNGQPGKGWPGLQGKCSLVKLGKHGHNQASLATLATKAWPSWPFYLQGRASQQVLSKKRGLPVDPGLKDLSQGRWPGLFEFSGQNVMTLSDCNIKSHNLWPFVVP